MVDRLEIPRIVDCFIVGIFLLLVYYTIEMTLGCFQKMRCVLSSERENQIVLTVCALLHYTDVEL